MLRIIHRALGTALAVLTIGQMAAAVNPAEWTIVEQLNRTDTTKTWVSPTPVDLNKMLWEYEYEITKLTGTVNLGIFGDVTEDITSSIPADMRFGSGVTRNLPAVLLDDTIMEPESGTSADVLVEVDNMGFGRAVFSNIMLGSINVPLFGSRPIQRVNIEASVRLVGYEFGDYNRNAIVDAADYVVWRETQGQSAPGLAADGNGDENVNAMDYAIWRANFGRGGGAALGSISVPEPAAFVLLFAASAALGFRRRRQIPLQLIRARG